MKRIILLSIIIAAIGLQSKSQDVKIKDKEKNSVEKSQVDEEDKRSNLFIGGGISFGLSSGGFNAGLHPHFGYTIAKWIDAAVVTNFEYNSQKDMFDNKYHFTTLGIGAFTRIYPVRFAFFQIQPELNYLHYKFLQNGGPALSENHTVPSLLVGIGVIPNRASKNTFSYFTLMIDVLKDVNSPYLDGNGNIKPMIRAGYNIGLFGKKKNY